MKQALDLLGGTFNPPPSFGGHVKCGRVKAEWSKNDGKRKSDSTILVGMWDLKLLSVKLTLL